jgi:cAMP-dependent protein kinase regulator
VEESVSALQVGEENVALGRRSRRTAVSAESYAPDDLTKRKKKSYPKSKEARAQIDEKLKTNFLFAHLDEEGRKDLCDAIFESKFQGGEIIIKQGDKGDNFYIVEKGKCEIFVDGTLVMTCVDGDSFGELALMYNSPRAATVQAVSDVVCWAMDRETFKLTLMDHTLKKRDRYEAFLEDVPILSSLLKYERLTIADALKPVEYVKGDEIVKQGDPGDNFYILESGLCNIFVHGKPAGEIESGGYFGELALLHGKPRAASIVAASDKVKVLALDRATFVGVMGSLHSILKRNAEQYTKYCAGMEEK